MNYQHKLIRADLKAKSPQRAIDTIRSFGLREDEETVLIEIDVNGLSYTQFADKYHVAPEVIKTRRNKAFAHIADALQYAKEKAGG